MTGRIASMAACAVLASALVGCSGDKDPVFTTDDVKVETTATETTQEATTTEAPTTVVTKTTISRDTELAVQQCLDASGLLMPVDLMVLGPESTQEAEELCKTAKQQADVDAEGVNTPSQKLVVALAERNVILSFAVLQKLSGQYDDAAQKKLTDDLAANDISIKAQLAQLT